MKWRAKLKKKRSKPKQLDKYLAYIDHYSSFSLLKKPSWLDDGYSTWCAVRIQSWWRMINVYRYCRYKSDIYEIAAIEIQTTFRSYRNYILEISHIQQQRPSSTQRSVKTVDSYARAIQYSWRRYCNMRVYKYFRDLVLHKLRGAPADLLRTIIPRESDLLDKASGIHVRFRLGGRAFPPKIYYKIFTHRALCDVNAFAPRNYCQERRLEPSSLHTKPESHRTTSIVSSMQRTHIRVGGAYFESLVTTEESNGWYRRQDTNPWRVISSEVDDLFDHQPYSYLDPSEASGLDTSLVAQYRRKVKMKSFHYSTLKRQQDVDQARKRKKREWMLKAYLLTAGSKGINYESEQASVGSDGSIYRRRADSTEEDVDQYGTENKPSIEMCDSFSSGASEGSRNRGLSEQADYKHHDDDYLGGKNEKAGRVAKPSGSQQDKQKNRGQIRYQPPINDDLDGGAEDALLKWR